MATLRPDIDYDLCKSHGVCARTAPDIFEVRDDGTYIIMEEVPENLRAKLQKTVELCPEQAISFKE
jgi:ferredoxin